MTQRVGYASLEVIPVMPGISEKLAAGITGPAGVAGTKAGTKAGTSFGKTFTTQATKTGKASGRTLVTQVEKSAVAGGLGIGRKMGARINSGLKEYTKVAAATVGTYFAAEKVKEFVTGIFEAGQESQRTTQLLEAHIKSTGGAANVTAQQVEELAASQAHLVGVDKDTILAGATLLTTFTNVRNEAGKGNDIFDRSVTTALDLSAALGTSLTSSMRLVGRATNDPVHGLTMLTRVGIQFTDAQKAQIAGLVASGKLLQAQGIVLDQLGVKFGGSAQAADTPMRQLTADFKTWEQGVGQEVIPILDEGAKILTHDVIPGFEGLAHVAGEIPGPVKEITFALIALKIASHFNLVGRGSFTDGVGARLLYMQDSLAAANKRLIAMRGGAAIAGGALLALQGRIGDTNQELGQLAGGAGMGLVAGAASGSVVVGALVGVGSLLHTAIEENGYHASAAMQALNDQIERVGIGGSKEKIQQISDGMAQLLTSLGIGVNTYTRALEGSDNAFGSVLLKAHGFGSELLIRPIEQARDAQDSWTASMRRQADQAGITAGANHHMGEAITEFGVDVEPLPAKVETLAQAQANLAKQTQRAYEAALRQDNEALQARGDYRGYQAAIDDASAALKKNGQTLDVQTPKGRANAEALDQIASSALAYANHMKEGSFRQITFLDKSREKLVAEAKQFGLTRGEAKKYVDTVLNFPVEGTYQQNFDATKAVIAQQNWRDSLDRLLAGIPDEPVNVTLTTRSSKVLDQLGNLGGAFAGGGAVSGPGGPTSDVIPAMLSAGERVNYAAVVTKAGHGSNARGQAVFAAIERAIMRGELGGLGDLQPFAAGGAVLPVVAGAGTAAAVAAAQGIFDNVDAALSAAISGAVSDKLTHLPTQGQLGPGGTLTPAQLVRGQDFAKSQVGKPYLWGGVGPGGYDCSGFQSAILNSAMGYANPYFRRGSTATMPWPGSAPGLGRYSIGWTADWAGTGIGHTAGNIGGLNVESYGGHGPAVGAGARSPLDSHFYGHMHYAGGGPVPFRHLDRGGALDPGLTLTYNGLGRREYPDPRGDTSSDVVAAIRSLEQMLRRPLHVVADNATEIASGVHGAVRRINDSDAADAARWASMGVPE